MAISLAIIDIISFLLKQSENASCIILLIISTNISAPSTVFPVEGVMPSELSESALHEQ